MLRSLLRKFLAFTFAFAAVLMLVGAAYQAIALRLDIQRSNRPGRLVAVDGFKLNMHCTGQGSPTVVLESGLADALDSWIRVQPEIARFTRVCSYDRAGYGYSEAGPMPRTSDRIAADLHTALENAGEKPPYLLVGHSFGGYNVRVFNGKYPEDVAGMILVDATQEDQYRLLPKAWANLAASTRQRAARQDFWAPMYIDLGVARLELLLQGRRAPPVILQSKYIRARTSELLNIEASAEQARAAGQTGQKPLIVLTAGKPVDSSLRAALGEQDCYAFQETWMNDLQVRLTKLSTRSTRRIVADSGHDMPSDNPEAIVTAVRDLSENLRNP